MKAKKPGFKSKLKRKPSKNGEAKGPSRGNPNLKKKNIPSGGKK